MTDPANQPVRRIVIIGGGTAGWLAAGVLASDHVSSGVSVTLVESPDVQTIGVGEGTWPTMRSTLSKIGLSETEFLKTCFGSFKQGTRFEGWVTGAADDYYYHPFTAPAGYPSLNLVPQWQHQRDQVSFANAVSIQGYLCDRKLAPKQLSTPEYAHVANYAYHLDAGRFAALLQAHCTEKLGVRHILDHVTGVVGKPDEDIRAVSTAKHGDLEGDLFIDCTGFRSLLLGDHYQVPYEDRQNNLFNDSALAMQVPYLDEDEPIASQTISVARRCGWIWDIGLTNRRGIGYTYSSAHTSDDDAETELREYVARTSGHPGDRFEARKIGFKPGHRASFWHRNCVAVGMSAGFLEPLEASALVLVELSARMISEELPVNRSVMDTQANRFNRKFRYRWDRIIDFLKLHYVLSQRTEPYWQDHRRAESIPEGLRESLAYWRYHVPWQTDFPEVDEIFSAASYQYVLYGMGFETLAREGGGYAADPDQANELFVENSQLANKLASNLPDNRKLLTELIG